MGSKMPDVHYGYELVDEEHVRWAVANYGWMSSLDLDKYSVRYGSTDHPYICRSVNMDEDFVDGMLKDEIYQEMSSDIEDAVGLDMEDIYVTSGCRGIDYEFCLEPQWVVYWYYETYLRYEYPLPTFMEKKRSDQLESLGYSIEVSRFDDYDHFAYVVKEIRAEDINARGFLDYDVEAQMAWEISDSLGRPLSEVDRGYSIQHSTNFVKLPKVHWRLDRSVLHKS